MSLNDITPVSNHETNSEVIPPEQLDSGNLTEKVHTMDEIEGATLSSQKQIVLNNIKKVIGRRQVTYRELEIAPQWLLDESLSGELWASWKDSYTEVTPSTIDKPAKVVSSHVIYKVKEGDDSQLKMKASLVFHGNGDRDRFSVHHDSLSADLSNVRLMISLAMVLDFKIATADVKGAYIQSGRIRCELYVRPPKNVAESNVLWKLLRLPYAVVEAWCQWLWVIEQWLTEVYRLKLIQVLDQFFTIMGETDVSNCL